MAGHGKTCRSTASFRSSALPQLLPFTTSSIYSHFRPETTVPDIPEKVSDAAEVAIQETIKRLPMEPFY
jgi:hypothetical protein